MQIESSDMFGVLNDNVPLWMGNVAHGTFMVSSVKERPPDGEAIKVLDGFNSKALESQSGAGLKFKYAAAN